MATYLVTQATGQQSQMVITYLLAAGAKVHAVVRDPLKIPSALDKQGITIFKGESTNFEEIFQAAQGCQGAFLNTFPIPGLEAQQAKTVVEACKKAGIESIVAATTVTVGNKAMWDDAATKEVGLREYFLSKAEVEEAVRNGNFKTYTIGFRQVES
ncbi:NmrA-like family domain-containing oxidoreductase malD [Trichoderma asperellum]|uniref:NmrA-like family domain-containing oxidoreductase malD n=1 Tax=Trichoderma asperellum TaxID=101201 RepID=A0A6V8QYY0_TRIAP|nr:NmrA-like family domain-containing oxidoreductase malD [Trichoderma asperellum]